MALITKFEEIGEETASSANLREIVRQFNQCLDKK